MRILVRAIMAVLVVVAGAFGWVVLLPDTRAPNAIGPGGTRERPPAPTTSTEPLRREVRVVYPDATTPITGPTSVVGDVQGATVTSSGPAHADTAVASVQLPVATGGPADVPPPVPSGAQPLPPPLSNTVNINTAPLDALNGIPGGGSIGRTIAAHRPYRSVEDLLRRRVLRRSVYERIKERLATQ